MQGLLDTGCTKSLVSKEFTTAKQRHGTGRHQHSSCGDGKTVVKTAAHLKLKLIKFLDSEVVDFQCVVDEKHKASNQPCDITLGVDFPHALGIVLSFESKTITWGPHVQQMQPMGDLDEETCQTICTMCNDPPVSQES